MFSFCNVNITAFRSVATTSYFLRRLRFICCLHYPLDSSTYHLIKSPLGLGSDKWLGSVFSANAGIISKPHRFRKFEATAAPEHTTPARNLQERTPA